MAITNTSAAQGFFDDNYGMYFDPYNLEKDDTQSQEYLNLIQESRNPFRGILNAFSFMQRPLLAGANLIGGGLSTLNRFINPQFTGVQGGQNLYGDSAFNTFARSTSLADFFQRRRDQQAREEAAATGLAKQQRQAGLAALSNVYSNVGQTRDRDNDRGGNTQGGFSGGPQGGSLGASLHG